MEIAKTSTVQQETLVAWLDNVSGTVTWSPSSLSQIGSDVSLNAALGGVAAVVLAGMSQSGAPATPESAPTITINGTITAGPVIEGNGLSITVYQADGTDIGLIIVTCDLSRDFYEATGTSLGPRRLSGPFRDSSADNPVLRQSASLDPLCDPSN